jgi:hypothetical protein
LKNLNNKQIIKINYLKFKKTPGMINFAKQIKLKFITQKRMLSTHLTDTEIFDKLNINIKSVLNGSKKNAYIRGYVNTLLILNSDLKSILTDNSLNFKEKQEKFEKLSQKNQFFNLELQYNVPKVLSKFINKLDSILLDSDNLKNDDVSSYLPSVLAEELGDHSNLKKSYKTKDLVQTITIFKDILKVFKYMDNSFGLFLIYNLVLFLRSDFNNLKLREKNKRK